MTRHVASTVVLVGLIAITGAASSPAQAGPGDPLLGDQWGLEAINAAPANAVADGRDVLVAVLDTGVDRGHPDLAGNVVDGPDLIGGDTTPEDDNGHGTHVTGIIAATADNGIGVRGAAPGATVLNIRVLDGDRAGTTQTVAEGVDAAIAAGARVINLSLGAVTGPDGGLAPTDPLALALGRATSAGVTVVAAAGNEGYPVCAQPIVVPQLICVAAVNERLQRSSFSNYGVRVDLVAPGGDDDGNAILSTTPGGEYGLMMGTSQATPFVSATAAALAGLGLSRDEIVGRLLSTSRDLGTPGVDFEFGHGLLDAAAAVSGLTAVVPAQREAKAQQRGRSTVTASSFLRRGLRVRCLLPPPGQCSGRLTVRGRTFGKGVGWVSDDAGQVVTIRPTGSARRALRRTRSLVARLTVGNPHVEPSTRTVRIRR